MQSYCIQQNNTTKVFSGQPAFIRIQQYVHVREDDMIGILQ